MKQFLLSIMILLSSYQISQAQCSPVVSCTFSETDLIGHSGVFVVGVDEILCIENSICIGITSQFPIFCANTGAASIINNGKIVICPGVVFEYAGSIQNLGIIQQLGGNSQLNIAGTIDCNNGQIQVTTPGLSQTCTEITGINSTSNAFCFNNNNSCAQNTTTTYCPWGSGPVGGLVVAGTCLLEGFPSDAVLLYLKIENFEAKRLNDYSNQLNWLSLDGSDTDYFEIQRSSDALNFETIGELMEAELVDSRRYYSYTDQSPQKGTNYYRLRHLSEAGEETLTNVVAVEGESETAQIEVYPTIVKDQLNIKSAKHTITAFRLINAFGQTVLFEEVNNQNLEINTNGISSTMLVLQLELEGGIKISRKIIKQ